MLRCFLAVSPILFVTSFKVAVLEASKWKKVKVTFLSSLFTESIFCSNLADTIAVVMFKMASIIRSCLEFLENGMIVFTSCFLI